MTDLAVTIYDTGNAIISIKVVLVRFFSLFGPSFSGHLMTPQQGTSCVPSKCLKRGTASNWHKTKAHRDQATSPKTWKTYSTASRAFTWNYLSAFSIPLMPCFWHSPLPAEKKMCHCPLSPTMALVPRGYDSTNGCVLVLQQLSLCQVIVRHEPRVCCGWSHFGTSGLMHSVIWT